MYWYPFGSGTPFGSFLTRYTPVIPQFYQNIYSQEEGIKKILFELDSLATYVNELAENSGSTDLTELKNTVATLGETVTTLQNTVTTLTETLNTVSTTVNTATTELATIKSGSTYNDINTNGFTYKEVTS